MRRLSFSSKKVLEGVVNFLFPPFCPACGDYLGWRGNPRSLCRSCLDSLEREALEFPHWAKDTGKLDALWSLARYGSEPLTSLLQKIKYQSKAWAMETVYPVLKKSLPARLFARIDLVIAVPVHPIRLRQRGFNQAELLAEQTAIFLGKPFKKNALIKKRRTKPQAELGGASERIKNISGSIEAAPDAGLDGKSVLIVDDVYTSGSTLGECAKVLKRAGAAKIKGLTLARAVP